MASYADLVNQIGSSNDMTNNWPVSASGSVSLGGSDYETSNAPNVLQRQYSLIHKSYNDVLRKRRQKEVVFCCGNERTRPWILRSAFLIVIALGLTISYFELRYSTYASRTVTLNTGDQLLLPISTYLNKEVKFNAERNNSNSLTLHVLRNMPNISSRVVNYESGVRFHMPSWTFQYWGFNLLTGSSVNIAVCTDLQIQFYVIRGEKKLEQWTQQILYNGYDYHKNIFPKSSCNKRSHFKSHLLTVTESDVYYILFSSSAGWRFYTEVNVLLQFNRTYYDFSNNLKYSCSLLNTSCISHLDEGSNDVSVIEADPPGEGVLPFHVMNVKYVPIPRVRLYFKLFGGIYLSILILAVIYIIWRMFVNFSSNNEKEPLVLSDHLNQQYHVINQDEKPWVVVSNIKRLNSKEATCEIDERETRSILGEETTSNFLVDSTSSREFMRHNNETANYAYRYEYNNNTQQLVDTCMTSAGTSAI